MDTKTIAIEAAFEAALCSENGISLHIESPEECCLTRFRCYSWRKQARKMGIEKYDNLSLIIRDLYELWIIPRKASLPPIKTTCIRNLRPFEPPAQINARGKARLGMSSLIGIY